MLLRNPNKKPVPYQASETEIRDQGVTSSVRSWRRISTAELAKEPIVLVTCTLNCAVLNRQSWGTRAIHVYFDRSCSNALHAVAEAALRVGSQTVVVVGDQCGSDLDTRRDGSLCMARDHGNVGVSSTTKLIWNWRYGNVRPPTEALSIAIDFAFLGTSFAHSTSNNLSAFCP